VKFFDFLNKAQIKAAKQISSALNKAASLADGADGEYYLHKIAYGVH